MEFPESFQVTITPELCELHKYEKGLDCPLAVAVSTALFITKATEYVQVSPIRESPYEASEIKSKVEINEGTFMRRDSKVLSTYKTEEPWNYLRYQEVKRSKQPVTLTLKVI